MKTPHGPTAPGFDVLNLGAVKLLVQPESGSDPSDADRVIFSSD